MADDEIARIAEEILSVTRDQMDKETAQYVAGMINEEGINNLSPDSLNDLIGPFFLDCNCATNEKAAYSICEILLVSLKNIFKLNLQDSEKDMEKVDVGLEAKTMQFEAPVTMKDLISCANANGFVDPFLGLQPGNVNYNLELPIVESIKLHKAAQREKEKKQLLLREWEKMKSPLPPLEKKHVNETKAKFTDISLENIAIQVAGKDLLHDAPLKLARGRKYGLIGRNGVGKSSLLRAIVRRDISGLPVDMTIGCVEQELMLTEETALQSVLDVDVERFKLLKEMHLLEKSTHTEEGGKRLAKIYDRLNEIEASKTYDQAVEILAGLGFSPQMQKQTLPSLSGGERMRVVLARALLADPDLLLLDEPSNHLDLHAIAWLTQYLKKTTKTVIIVSHARQLLNDVCSEIIFFANKTLQYFKGNYDQYEQSLATQLKVQHRQFEIQEQKRKHMQQFIDKFRYNAKRASLVQSRLKALNKLPTLEDIIEDPTTHFDFEDTYENISPPVLQFEDVCFRYDGKQTSENGRWILKNVNLNVDLDSRVAVCGVNGSGKSTLLSLLSGAIEPLSGRIIRSSKLRIGLYTQQHIDQLDLTLTAVQQLQARYPEANLKDEDARNFLGRFGITKMLSMEPLYVLSGGQKSRVCIALMAYRKPNLLILDEPTNHLDMDAIQALLLALKTFCGGVVVVSHDAFFLEHLCEEIWHIVVEDASCKRLTCSFSDFWSSFVKVSKADSTI